MGLSLLATASMPFKYWDEAFLAGTYLINRTPTKLLNYDTPFIHSLVPHLIILAFEFLSARVGRIYVHIILINSNSDPFDAFFLTLATCIKTTNV
jgi:hypothetical protein